MPIIEFDIAIDSDDGHVYFDDASWPAVLAATTGETESETVNKAETSLEGGLYKLATLYLRWLVSMQTDGSPFEVYLRIYPTTISGAANAPVLLGTWKDAGVAIDVTQLKIAPSGQPAFSRPFSALVLNAYNDILLSDIAGFHPPPGEGNNLVQTQRNVPFSGHTGLVLTVSTTGTPTQVNRLIIQGYGQANPPRLRLAYSRVQQPADLAPASGARAVGNVVFSWRHVDNAGSQQGKFDLEYQMNGGAWQAVSQQTANQNVTINIGTRGQVNWRVRTYDADLLAGNWSAQASFFAGNAATAPVIVLPANASVLGVPRFTVQWTSLDQKAYLVKVLRADGSTLWTSAQTTDTATSITTGADAPNLAVLAVEVYIMNSDDVWSAAASVSVSTNFVEPAQPTAVVAAFYGGIKVTPQNPTPAGAQPAIAYNEIWRKAANELAFRRIGTVPNNDPLGYDDWFAQSGLDYQYRVRAVGVNGVPKDSISYAGVTEWQDAVLLTDVFDPAGSLVIIPGYEPSADDDWRKDSAQVDYLGRDKPQTVMGKQVTEFFRFQFTNMKASGDIWQAYKDALNRASTYCVRTPGDQAAPGEKYIGSITRRPRRIDFIGKADVVTLQLESNSWTEDI